MLESKEYKFNSFLEAVEKFIEFKEILNTKKIIGNIKSYSLDLKTVNDLTVIKVSFE